MKIVEVALDGMGCFQGNGNAFDFNGDRVVVLGPNEAGKSTLARSIDALLFGFEKADEESRWRPWGSARRFGGRIAFEIKGDKFELDREFGKDYVRLMRNGKVVFEDEANPRGKTGEPFREVLSGILPLTRSRFFQCLSFVRQEEMQTSISEDLRERITGGHRLDALKVRENLEGMYAELTWEKPPWGSALRKRRIIEELEDQLKDKRERRNRAVEATRRGSQVESDLQALEAKIKETEKERDTSKLVLDKQQHLLRLLELESQMREKLVGLGEELERVERLTRSAQSLEAGVREDFPEMAAMPPDTAELLHALKAKSAQEADVIKQISDCENATAEERKKGTAGWFHYAIAVAAGAILGSLAGLIIGRLVLVGLIGAVVGILTAIMWTQKLRSKRRQQLRALTQELAILTNQHAKISEELKPLRAQLMPMLKDSNSDEALRKWKSYQELNVELMKTQAGLSNNRPFDTIKIDHKNVEIEYRRIVDKIEQSVEKNPYLSVFRKEPQKLGIDVEKRLQEMQKLDDDLENRKKQREKLSVEWRLQAEGGVDDVDSLEAELQTFERSLADHLRKKAALILAWECLTEAIDGIRDEHHGIIQQRMDELFRTWTNRTERSVILDEDWNPWIVQPDNPCVAPEMLSRGTLDQLYLAFRVALSEALSRDVPLPFLLDDPFVHFDPERRRLAREAFEAISERHQVILFTQDPDFRDWGKLVRL